ncbi:hypothetical protein FOL47_005289 [Perkinsus chesapeaki]|uniref:Uncharacterized protein n=1 Tax=Perkinsus chesapeaki TaxID=330153 RepID=A0A7J6LY40_PERCH|nr:hypothetical protein FOL47_005289 [Perkinsus chesapeaki]
MFSSSSGMASSSSSSVFESMLASMQESMKELTEMKDTLHQQGHHHTGSSTARRISEEYDEVVALSQVEEDAETPLGHIPLDRSATEPSSTLGYVSITVQKPSPAESLTPQAASANPGEEAWSSARMEEEEDSEFTATFNMLQYELESLKETMKVVHNQPEGHRDSESSATAIRMASASSGSATAPADGDTAPRPIGGHAPATPVRLPPLELGQASSASSSSSSSSSAAVVAPDRPVVDPLGDAMVRGTSFTSTADSSPPSTAASTSLANSGLRQRLTSLDSVPEPPEEILERREAEYEEEEYEDDFEEIGSNATASRPSSPAFKPARPVVEAVTLAEVPEEVIERDLLDLTPQTTKSEPATDRSATNRHVESAKRALASPIPTVPAASSPHLVGGGGGGPVRVVEWATVADSYVTPRPSSIPADYHTKHADEGSAATSTRRDFSPKLSSPRPPVENLSGGTVASKEQDRNTAAYESMAIEHAISHGNAEKENTPKQTSRPQVATHCSDLEQQQPRQKPRSTVRQQPKDHTHEVAAPEYPEMKGIEVLASAGRSVLSPTLLNYPCPLCHSAGPVAVPAGHILDPNGRDLWEECLPHLFCGSRERSPLDGMLHKHFNLSPILSTSGHVAAELSRACSYWREGLEAADEDEWTVAVDAYRLALEALPSRWGFEYISHWNATLLYHASGKRQARDRQLREWRRVCRQSLPRNRGCRLCRR